MGAVGVGAYFSFGFLPSAWQDQGKAALAGINFARFAPSNLLPELKAKIEPIRERLLPDNPVKRREALIEKLAGNLETISKNQNPKTAEARLTLKTAATEAKGILAEIKEENPKSGVINSALLGVIEKVFPAPPASNSEVCK